MGQSSGWFTVLGAAIALAGVVLSQWWADRRDRRNKEHDAALQERRRRAEYQVRNLEAMQDATRRFMGVIGAHADLIGSSRRTDPKYVGMAIEAARSYTEVQYEVYGLSLRVADPQIRQVALELLRKGGESRKAFLAVLETSDKQADAEEARSRLEEAKDRIIALNTRIGELLSAE